MLDHPYQADGAAPADSPDGQDPAAAPPPRPRIRIRMCGQELAQSADGAGPGAGDTDYAVGYRKPPRHSQFRPGKSGNPRGRPKAAKGLKTIVRETMAAKIPVRTAGGETKMSRIEAVLHKTIELAMKGNHRAQHQLILLYGAAVPEAEAPVAARARAEDLTAADLALLEEYKAELLTEQGNVP